MIEIYQWDVIDMKMKEHLSKNQFQLYKKVKNSRTLSHQRQSSSHSKLSTNSHKKTSQFKYSFLDKKNQKLKERQCLQLRAKQHKEIRPLQKSQAQISINQILAIRQYGSGNSEAQAKNIQKMENRKVQILHQPTFEHLKLHKRAYSQSKLLRTEPSLKSTKKSDKSLSKIQRNKKYSVLSTFMTVKKVNIEEKNTSKCSNLTLSRKPSIAIKCQQSTVGSPNISQEEKHLFEENREFKSLSSRPKTAEVLCNQKNLNLRIFLDLTGIHKKPLKL